MIETAPANIAVGPQHPFEEAKGRAMGRIGFKSSPTEQRAKVAASPPVPYDRHAADMARFAGKVIAYRDGGGVLGSAASFEELYDRLDAAGLLDEHVVFDMIPGREKSPP